MKFVIDNSFVPEHNNLAFSTYNVSNRVSMRIASGESETDITETIITLDYRAKPSDSGDVHPEINQSIYVDGTNGVVKANGEVDDSVQITVGKQSRGGAFEAQVHPFNYDFEDLSEGYYTVSVNHFNVSGGDYPENNLSYLKGTISCMPIGITPEENEELICECGICTASSSSSGGGGSVSRSSSNSSSAFVSSQGGSSSVRSINNQFMRWACNFATFRGMGDMPDGLLEIVGYAFSPELLTPASLKFNHPAAAALTVESGYSLMPQRANLPQSSSIIAPNKAMRLDLGASYSNFVCDADGYSAFAVGATKKSAYKTNFVKNVSLIDGDNIGVLGDSNYLRIQAPNSTALFFAPATGQLRALASPSGFVASVEQLSNYLALVREAGTGTIRQIWNYWDGLADVVPAPEGEVGYSIHFYTPSQVGARDEATGLYSAIGSPFKSYVISGDVATSTITVTEIDHSQASVVEPLVASWKEHYGAWTLTQGTGKEAIIQRNARTSIASESASTTIFGVEESIYKVNAAGEEEIASCTLKVYAVLPSGKCLIEQIDGYGSDDAQQTLNVYNTETGQLLTSTSQNGGQTLYSYDARGRVSTIARPWADGGQLVTTTTYVNDGSIFDGEIQSIKQHSYDANSQYAPQTSKTYDYSLVNSIRRVVETITAGDSSLTQTTITETWDGSSTVPYTSGRVRMTQDITGVQTWHDYQATSLHGAIYTHTTETRVANTPINGQSLRTIEYVTAEGNTVRKEEYVLDKNGDWKLINAVTNRFDEQNRLIASQKENGRSSTYGYVCTGQYLWVVDENGVRTDFAYDSARTQIEQTRHATATTPETITEWVKDAAGRILQTKTFTGPMETTTSTTYDILGRVINQTDELGRVTTTSYSADGLIRTSTIPSGASLITRTSTDGYTVLEESGTGQRHILITYRNINHEQVKSTILPDATLIQQECYNGFAQLVKTVEPTTIIGQNIDTVYEYDAKGQLIREQRADLAATTYQYDSMGNVVRKALVLNPYDPNADRKELSNTFVETAEDGIYQVVEYTHFNDNGDALLSIEKRLISELSDTIESKEISIDERGNTSTSTINYGNTLTQRIQTDVIPSSDSHIVLNIDDGFTLSQIDQLGGTTSYTRDYTATGITSTVTDPRGNTTTSKTDIAGRIIEQIDAATNTTKTTYCNGFDKPASITDALGNVINYSYDQRGRKIAEYGTGVQPSSYAYDEANRMISFTTYRVDNETITTDPTGRTGDTTSINYDNATGLELSKTYANGTTKTRSYDALNRLQVLTNARSLTTTYSYDAVTGDITQIVYSDGTPSENFAYNALGYLTRVQDDNGICALAYNHYNQFYSEDVVGYVREEAFDDLGRSSSYALYKDWVEQQVVLQSYDSKGRIATAGFRENGGESNFTYAYLNGTAMLTSITHPNGIVSARTYEAQRNLLTAITDTKNGSTLSSKSYTYDAIGRPTARNINARSDSFGYNGKSELTSAALGSDNYAYDYDNIGNRKTAQEIAEQITYETNRLNQYTEIQGSTDFTPEFDLDGNQTKIQTATGIWSVVYNAKNRPTSFTSEDGAWVIECNYDYMGRRVRKHVIHNGHSHSYQQYLYRGYLQIAAIDLNSESMLHRILWDPSEPEVTRALAIQQDGTWYSYGLDLSKNITELYTAEGTFANTYSYSPFGAVEVTGNVVQPLQWSSEVYDSELGLVYYNYRSYNPTDGRWINRDPIGIEGGMNLYVFVNNQPTGILDKLGLEIVSDDFGRECCKSEIQTIHAIALPFEVSPPGHSFIHCPGVGFRGRYPNKGKVGGNSVYSAGKIKDDYDVYNKYKDSGDLKIISYRACPESVGKMKELIEKEERNPRNYNLAGNHCVDFVDDMIYETRTDENKKDQMPTVRPLIYPPGSDKPTAQEVEGNDWGKKDTPRGVKLPLYSWDF